MPAAVNLQGRIFGRLTVLARAHTPVWAESRPWWHCRCECGNTVNVRAHALVSGNTRSCGCLHSEICAKRLTTHGRSDTPEYGIWSNMHDRCRNPHNQDYKHYGGRGIYVDAPWDSFEQFWSDRCPRPSRRHELDRIDNNGPYSAANTRWVLHREQTNNKRSNHRLTFNGRTLTIAEWTRELGWPNYTIRNRLALGWDLVRIFTEPPHKRPRQ